MMQRYVSQRIRDESAVLKYAMSTDFDDGLAGLSEIGPSVNCRISTREPGHTDDELPHIRWVAPPETGTVLHVQTQSPRNSNECLTDRHLSQLSAEHAPPGTMPHVMGWSVTLDGAHGHRKLREFLASAAERLHELGEDDASASMLGAANCVEPPCEWMSEAALAIKAELALPTLPSDLRDELDSALTAIRTGFRKTGQVPNF
jgi:hypothetical protein